MLMCDCTNCGGKDEFAMCENGLLRAQGMVHSSQRLSRRINVLLFALVVVFLASLALPNSHEQQEHNTGKPNSTTQSLQKQAD